MGRASVAGKETATTVGPFLSISKREYHAWAYCLDKDYNYYA